MRRQNDIMTEGVMTKEIGAIMCLLKRHNKKGQRVDKRNKRGDGKRQKSKGVSHLRFEFSLHYSGKNTPKNTQKTAFFNVFVTNSISVYCKIA